jgi:hypothetical protein
MGFLRKLVVAMQPHPVLSKNSICVKKINHITGTEQ